MEGQIILNFGKKSPKPFLSVVILIILVFISNHAVTSHKHDYCVYQCGIDS